MAWLPQQDCCSGITRSKRRRRGAPFLVVMCLCLVTLSVVADGGKLTESFTRSLCLLISFCSICMTTAVEMTSNLTDVMMSVITAV